MLAFFRHIYISHLGLHSIHNNTIYRKSRFRPLRIRNPLNRFWWNLAWLIMFETLLHMTTLVGITLRRWSGHIFDLSDFLLFFLSALFVTRPGRISWPSGTSTRCDKSHVCPDHPRCATPTKVIMWGGVPDVVNNAKFHQNRLRGFGSIRGRNLLFSICSVVYGRNFFIPRWRTWMYIWKKPTSLFWFLIP